MDTPTLPPEPKAEPARRAYTRYDPNKKRVLELKIFQLRSQRFSFPEIGSYLGMDANTAKWWYHEYLKRNDRSFNDLAAKSLAQELISRSKQRLHTMDTLYRSTTNDNVKLGLLNADRLECEHILATAKDLNLVVDVPKSPEQTGLAEIAQAVRDLVPASKRHELANRIRSALARN